MAKIMAWHFGRALVEAGVLTQEELNETHRIVIDATSGQPAFIYIQRFGDDKLAKLAPMIKDMIEDDPAPPKQVHDPSCLHGGQPHSGGCFGEPD
jgi:hypothetical protein